MVYVPRLAYVLITAIIIDINFNCKLQFVLRRCRDKITITSYARHVKAVCLFLWLDYVNLFRCETV
jgi:hypothetical protein